MNFNRTSVLTVSTRYQLLTKKTAYNSDYVKPLSELSCLESRLISELQGAPGSRDHQASPSSLFGYQNTTNSNQPKFLALQTQPFYYFTCVALPQWLCLSCFATVALPQLLCHSGFATVQFSLCLYL